MKTGYPKLAFKPSRDAKVDLKSVTKEFDNLVENPPKARVDLEDWEGVLWLKITDEEGRYSYVKRDEAVDLIRKVLPFVS